MPQLHLLEEAHSTIREALAQANAPCVTTSFQVDGMVLVHLLTQQCPRIPVLFVDTGYHFPETYEYRDAISSRFGWNIVNLKAAQTVREQESQFGILHQASPDRCCALRKVEPLFAGLEDYDLWFAALRRDQSPTRANLKVRDNFPLPGGRSIAKVSPLAAWNSEDVWEYLDENGIPPLPLYDQGYQSIGCKPCTSLPIDPSNPRSGRWSGRKLECGIHVPAAS